MKFWEIILISVGLSMDAFAVSICKGLSAGKATNKQGMTAGFWFGGFQSLMPVIGYALGYQFKGVISAVDHWIAFILLGWIGIGMLKDAQKEECAVGGFSAQTMFPMAVATSIDALATGVMFSFLNVNIAVCAASIGTITFVMSYIGIKAGTMLGSCFQKGAQMLGGVVLIAMGVKILIEHLFFS